MKCSPFCTRPDCVRCRRARDAELDADLDLIFIVCGFLVLGGIALATALVVAVK